MLRINTYWCWSACPLFTFSSKCIAKFITGNFFGKLNISRINDEMVYSLIQTDKLIFLKCISKIPSGSYRSVFCRFQSWKMDNLICLIFSYRLNISRTDDNISTYNIWYDFFHEMYIRNFIWKPPFSFYVNFNIERSKFFVFEISRKNKIFDEMIIICYRNIFL